MRALKLQPHPKFSIIVVLLALVFGAGCSIHEQKSGDKGDKKVEIKTPFGQMKVNTEVDPRDTGLPVYPGARRAASDDDHDKNAANVNISSDLFGLKVVAVKFESDDPPQKVLDFYRDKVKAFGGKYLECKEGEGVVMTHDSEDRELTCGKERHGNAVELKAGTPDRQHVVAVKPHGDGSEFTLVYVNKRGKEAEM